MHIHPLINQSWTPPAKNTQPSALNPVGAIGAKSTAGKTTAVMAQPVPATQPGAEDEAQTTAQSTADAWMSPNGGNRRPFDGMGAAASQATASLLSQDAGAPQQTATGSANLVNILV
jgi:hypothetical protein